MAAKSGPIKTHGIGEWYGVPLHAMTAKRRAELAAQQFRPKSKREQMACPFRWGSATPAICSKDGGVCSLLPYTRGDDGEGVLAPDATLSTTCPYRFDEGGLIYGWVSSLLLGADSPAIVREVGFLEREPQADAEAAPGREDVGRIDTVLVAPDSDPLRWCALEMQAVYFSGATMRVEFEALRDWHGPGIPCPAGRRRPDVRSSGPKRLMPQLQVKVPALRRWGKRMAVVVDESFFGALGAMDQVGDVSNCDIVWFVVGYAPSHNGYGLVLKETRLTTLERAVEGLTAGRPVSQSTFENRIRDRLRRG